MAGIEKTLSPEKLQGCIYDTEFTAPILDITICGAVFLDTSPARNIRISTVYSIQGHGQFRRRLNVKNRGFHRIRRLRFFVVLDHGAFQGFRESIRAVCAVDSRRLKSGLTSLALIARGQLLHQKLQYCSLDIVEIEKSSPKRWCGNGCKSGAQFVATFFGYTIFYGADFH